MIPRRLLTPQLATLVKDAPAGEAWLHEIKYDGWRIMASREGDTVRLLSRTGKDYATTFPEIVRAVAELPASRLVLDGEVAIVDAAGRTSFQALQNHRGVPGSLAYFVFDLLVLDDEVLAEQPLDARKARLAALLARAPRVSRLRYSDHVVGHGASFFRAACTQHLEGIVSKRRDRPYRAGRNSDWVKVKCTARQELVIGGYTPGAGAFAGGLGALLCGYHDTHGELVYAGKVGTGFDRATADQLLARLRRLERERCPFTVAMPRGALAQHARWVTPRLVAEVEFTEWTADGRLRHPSFKGLRVDKSPEEVVREQPRTNERERSPQGRLRQ